MQHQLFRHRATTLLYTLLVLSLFLTGCGSSSDNQVARLRFLHASPGSPALDIFVDSLIVLTQFNYAEASTYLQIDEGTRQISVNSAGTTQPLIDLSLNLKDGTDYTLLIANSAPHVEGVLIEDSNVEPKFGEMKIRFVNSAPSAPDLDVYITNQNDDLAGAISNFSNLSFGQSSEYQGLDEGEYRIRFTQAGTKTVLIDSGGIRFDAGQIRTLVALDSAGGGGPYRAILLADRKD